MKTDNIQNLLQFQLMSQMFNSSDKSSSSNMAFAVVMESLLKAMTDSNCDLSKLGYCEGEKLDYGVSSKEQPIKYQVNNSKGSGDIKVSNERIAAAINRASRKYNVDEKLIKSVIMQESSFNPMSTSCVGAKGLMQLMPETAREVGVTNPYDIDQNVDGGTKYLKELLNLYGNNKELSLAAYNAGPGTLINRGVNDPSKINRLPYETRDYVKKVMRNYTR